MRRECQGSILISPLSFCVLCSWRTTLQQSLLLELRKIDFESAASDCVQALGPWGLLCILQHVLRVDLRPPLKKHNNLRQRPTLPLIPPKHPFVIPLDSKQQHKVRAGGSPTGSGRTEECESVWQQRIWGIIWRNYQFLKNAREKETNALVCGSMLSFYICFVKLICRANIAQETLLLQQSEP